MTDLDLDAITAKWLQLCGACDAGIGMCTHPDEDYRPVMERLVAEVQRLRGENMRLHAVVEVVVAWWAQLPEAPNPSYYTDETAAVYTAVTQYVKSNKSASSPIQPQQGGDPS